MIAPARANLWREPTMTIAWQRSTTPFVPENVACRCHYYRGLGHARDVKLAARKLTRINLGLAANLSGKLKPPHCPSLCLVLLIVRSFLLRRTLAISEGNIPGQVTIRPSGQPMRKSEKIRKFRFNVCRIFDLR